MKNDAMASVDNISIRSAYLEITSRCNMSCGHCYNNSGYLNEQFITPKECEIILSKLRELKCEQIVFSGGEPLIHPKIIDYLKLTRELGIHNVSVITNGLIFNDQFAKACQSNDVTIIVSFDGIDSFSYSLFRNAKHFQCVQANVIKYSEICNVEINMVLNSRNCASINNMAKFAVENNIKAINLLNLCYTGRNTDYFEIASLNKSALLICRRDILKAKDTYPELRIGGAVNPMMENTCRYLINAINSERHVRIDSNGDLYPCSASTRSIGNILQMEIKEIQHILKESSSGEVRKRFVKLYTDCSMCEVRKFCKKGCPLLFTEKKHMKAYCEDIIASHKNMADERVLVEVEHTNETGRSV